MLVGRRRARRTSATGPAGSAVVRARSCARQHRQVAGVLRAAPSTARPSSPRAGTPAWSAEACRAARPDRPQPRSASGIEDDPPGTVIAGAGATLAAVQAHARRRWAYGVDFAARDSATVGGPIATDAGGIARRPPRHARPVAGVEAVLADGTVVDRRRAPGRRRRLRPAGLLTGSEGTSASSRARTCAWSRPARPSAALAAAPAPTRRSRPPRRSDARSPTSTPSS